MRSQEIRDTISYQINQIAKMHRHEISNQFSKLGLHPGQDLILHFLWNEDGLTQTQLNQRLQVEPPTITKMIHRMERAGLLNRHRDPNDARISRVYLTELGRNLEDPVRQIWQDVENRMLEGMSLHNQNNLKQLLTGLHKQFSFH